VRMLPPPTIHSSVIGTRMKPHRTLVSNISSALRELGQAAAGKA
jgi:hypothetical protein